MDFNGSMFRICGAGAAEAGTFLPGAGAGAGALMTLYLEPEPELEPKCFPGVVTNFHGSAFLICAPPICTPSVFGTLDECRPK